MHLVLVEPAGPLNVGSVARLCANFGIGQLRLVAPRCDPLDPEALRMAVHGRPVLEAAQAMKPLAAEAGLSLAQFALAWVLREPNVASAIVGASRPEQLDENAAAVEARVDPALFAKAEAIAAGAREAN